MRSVLLVVLATFTAASSLQGSKPNIIWLFADDFGWADVGQNNPAVSETPTLDALAKSGIHFTDAHAFPLCTPSRAQLLTGRVGARTGVTTNFGTGALHGLPRTERTVAELLKPAGYDTAMAGKWHLGTHPGFHPSYRGFDRILSVPYSVDMGCLGPAGGPFYNHPQDAPCATGPNKQPPSYAGAPALPLYNSTVNCSNTANATCNGDIVQQPVVEDELATNYATFASDFIRSHPPGSAPYFLYMAFSHTHVPLFHDPRFTNASARKTVFADTTLELDTTIRTIYQALVASGQANNTLILATADNGPWAVKCEYAGWTASPGMPYIGAYQKQLGGGSPFKDTTWEGGQREFGLAHWQGVIAPGQVSHATVSTLDWLPTALALAGVPLPADRHYDGVDLAPILFGNNSQTPQPKVRDYLFMGDTTSIAGNITAVRYLNYKLYTKTYSQASCTELPAAPVDHPDYLVFDLDADPAESTPITLSPALLAQIHATHAAYLADIAGSFRSETSYDSGTMTADAPCCNPGNAVCRCSAREEVLMVD